MGFPSREFLIDTLKGSVCTVALFLAYVTLPLFGIFGGMLAPVPAIYYALRSGHGRSAAISACAAVVLALLGDSRILLLFLLQAVPVALLLPYFLQSSSVSGAIVRTAYISLAVMVVAGFIFSLSTGANLDAEVQKWLSSGIAQTASLYSKSGLKEDEVQALQQGLQQAGSVMTRIYPALLAIGQGMVVCMSMLAITGFVRRGKIQLEISEFSGFKNADPLIWLLILSGFGMLIPQDLAARIALNLFLVVACAYFIQGLAVMAHFFTRFSVPAFGRFMFYTFLLLQPYLLAGVALIGIFDMWGNFRTPRQQNL